jgi:hypothetical protein
MEEFYFCKAVMLHYTSILHNMHWKSACNHTVEVQKIEVEDLNNDEV